MAQDRAIFDKDTFLDLTVNIIPLFILAFFFVVFLPMVYGPFGWNTTYSVLQMGLIVVPAVLLAILTYFSAVAIEGDANETEAREAAAADPETVTDDDSATDEADGADAVETQEPSDETAADEAATDDEDDEE
jgi:hypothetical protein